jgi:hypothetical protein
LGEVGAEALSKQHDVIRQTDLSCQMESVRLCKTGLPDSSGTNRHWPVRLERPARQFAVILRRCVVPMENGALAFLPGSSAFGEHKLVSVDRSGKTQTIREKLHVRLGLRLSPDGRRIAMGLHEAGHAPDIWILDLARGSLSPVTHGRPATSIPFGLRTANDFSMSPRGHEDQRNPGLEPAIVRLNRSHSQRSEWHASHVTHPSGSSERKGRKATRTATQELHQRRGAPKICGVSVFCHSPSFWSDAAQPKDSLVRAA